MHHITIIESMDNTAKTTKIHQIGKRKFNEIMNLPCITYTYTNFGTTQPEHEEQNYFGTFPCPTLEGVSKYRFVIDPFEQLTEGDLDDAWRKMCDLEEFA